MVIDVQKFAGIGPSMALTVGIVAFAPSPTHSRCPTC